MSEFTDLASGGRALVPMLERFKGRSDVLVLAVVPNGVPAAIEVARALVLPVRRVDVERDAHGVSGVALPDLDGFAHLIVVDDAVESGSAARAVGAALRDATGGELTLAVPVGVSAACAELSTIFDHVVTAVRSAERHALTEYYSDLTLLSGDEGLALLAQFEND
jgi:predicted phosphoribosyltransferase